jgi:hypothetical protein
VSAPGYRVVYDEDVRQVVADLPEPGKRALAELFRDLTRATPLLERLRAGPAGREVTYVSGQDLLLAYRVDQAKRIVQVLSVVWLGTR